MCTILFPKNGLNLKYLSPMCKISGLLKMAQSILLVPTMASRAVSRWSTALVQKICFHKPMMALYFGGQWTLLKHRNLQKSPSVGSLQILVLDCSSGFTQMGLHSTPAGSSKPQSLLFVDNTLYIAGEDGIFKQDWPTGTPQQIDDRTALALEWIDGSIWSGNSSDGIFEVEGHSVGLNQAARPGSLLMTESGLFFR